MSRAYRVAIRERIRRVLRASDRVSTQLEIIEILPAERMAGLLARELEQRGFRVEDGNMVRDQNGVTVTVDPGTGVVTVTAEGSKEVALQKEKEGRAYDDLG